MKSKEKQLNIVVVSEGGIGKTCLLIRYIEGRFPEGRFPEEKAFIPVQYNKDSSVSIADGSVTYKLNIIDSGGSGEDFHRLRPIYYPGQDIVVMCFAIDSRWTYDGILNIWKTEIQRFIPNTPIILVGTKCDLDRVISLEEAEQLKETMKAALYIECSSKEDINVGLIFSSSITVFANHLEEKKKRKNKRCSVL